jgi:SSS family solute:Na+ symporter
MIVGAVAWFFWTALIHAAESKPLGICQALFGTPALLPLPWSVIDPLMIALPLSAVTVLLVQWYDANHGAARPPVAVPAES